MGLECMICLNKLLPRQNNTHASNCGHLFHYACVQDWMKTNKTCPSCRMNNPLIFQIFLDAAETDDDYEPQYKLQNDILTASINDLSNQLKENKRQFDELYGMIEQITISVSSFEVQNQELRRQNDNLQQLLEAKTLQDSQRQLETKENNPRLSSKTSLAEGNNREQKTSKSLTLRFDDMNQIVIIE